MASKCSIECSWLLGQSKIPFIIRKCAHLVVSAHISLQVKHLTEVGREEKQNHIVSTTSPLWFWRRIRLVVHFREKFLSFLCCGTSCFKNYFSSQCQKKTCFIFQPIIPHFFRYSGWPDGPEQWRSQPRNLGGQKIGRGQNV